MIDIKIINGTIIDGTGNERYHADIGIVNNSIKVIGDLSEVESVHTIDAVGCVVSPGFIDIHTHSDISLLIDGHADARLRDGVTTDVIGNCGIGTAPVKEKNKQLLMDYLGTRMIGSLPINMDLEWNTVKEYLNYVNAHELSINVAPLVAQGTVRIAEMGFSSQKANREQIRSMQNMVTEAMEAGTLGITTGLAYLPGAYTDWEELCEVTKPVSPFGGIYISHIRNQSEGIWDSIDEAVRIGRNADVPVHISHLKLAGPLVRGKTERLFRYLEQIEKDGVDISFDVYPYDAGNTALTTVLPPWVFEGGIHNLLQRIQVPELRQRIREDCEIGISGWQNYSRDLGWSKILVSATVTEQGKQWEGRTIQDIADEQNEDPWDTVFNILIQEDARVQTIVSHLDEKDVESIVAHPKAMYGSDTMSLSSKGKLSSGKPHPRAFGTHGKILRKYVREKHLMTLEQAIHKMSGLPAKRLNIRKRGILKEGYYADIVIFNPDTITDHATYQNPIQYTTGVETVIVNGQVTMKNNEHQEVFPGRVVGR